jgi:pimeloyl-ACP methyl ester carboxylesterase
MVFDIKEEGGFKFIDEGKGDTLLLLHGLFGALSNWECVVREFSVNYRVVIPLMPIYEMPISSAGMEGLVAFIENFVAFKSLKNLTLLGNSLGGHIALIYTLNNKENVKRLVLTGSSGLFENSMGGSFPKRGSYDYIKERVEYTFFDPATASEELVDEVFDITKSIPKCMRIVAIAKSAQRHNMAKEITKIEVPTLLVWGLNDTITPPVIDKCGHAPMMEHPEKFNKLLNKFMEVEQLV